VPVPNGGDLCLYPDKPTLSSHWDVYDWIGICVARLDFTGGNQACWNVSGLSPGIYIVRMKINYSDGSDRTTWQKIVVAR
jgi:hypothetical protein